MTRRVTCVLSAAAAALMMVGSSGCAPQPEQLLCGDPAAGRIHGTPLREVMHKLYYAVYEDQHLSELERDDLRQRYALDLAESVAALVKEVGEAPSTMPGVELDAPDAAAYAAYARELGARGEAIRAVAEAYETEKIGPAVEGMIDLCNRCHAHFEIPFVCGRP